ncbi:tetratricopeptide repeat protein, partial [Kitasatospora sp. NPDC059571]|uniref:tetratricopeptide repeat protein n=1 Tax=Kitasatospora sp. NPDC059571 TaxID=3346871 RepID=UPI0036B0221A
MALFAENLAKDPDPDDGAEPADFLFHVRGVGGVGKSTLLAQWREAARRAGCLTALVDEAEVESVESALIALSRQLAEQCGPLKEFDKAVDQHHRAQQATSGLIPEQSSTGDAPSLPARLVTQAALGAASALPGASIVTAMTNPEAVAQGADRLIAAARRRRPASGPEEAALSQAFVGELRRVCDRSPRRRVVFFFDTWELTSRFLDSWLRGILDGDFGDLPLEVVFVLAGRDELKEQKWGALRSFVVDVPLDVFTDHEARELLAARGVSDPDVLDAILRMSMRLPLLLTLLAHTRPGAVDDVVGVGADIVDDAVDRFLQWITEPDYRKTVLAAALPLRLNRDIFSCAVPDAESTAWDWLLGQPFVAGNGDFRQYHAVVRASMLRQRRTQVPGAWRADHVRLADSHAAARLVVEQRLSILNFGRDAVWRRHLLDETYHLLCADPSNMAVALERTARIAGEASDTLAAWAEMLNQAGQDSDGVELTNWASQIRTAASTASPAVETLTLLTAGGLPSLARAWAFTYRALHLLLEAFENDDLVNIGRVLADLDRALSLNSSLPVALAIRGTVHNLRNSNEQALADLTAALAVDPTLEIALQQRGEVYQQAGRLEDAIADFTAALTIDPDNAWAFASRGQVHQQAGRLEDAVTDLTAAITIDPDNALALGSRGEVHQQAGRLEYAMADFTAALTHYP